LTVTVAARDGGSSFVVRVQPGASRSGVVGEQAGVLRLRVCSPPVDGRANAEVVAVLAEVLGLRPRQIEVVSGQTSRTKTVWIALPPVELEPRLAEVDGVTG